MKHLRIHDDVRRCIGEICGYYKACNDGIAASVLVSKSMLTFALELPDAKHLEPILLTLKEAGAVLAVADSMVAFSTQFVCGEV